MFKKIVTACVIAVAANASTGAELRALTSQYIEAAKNADHASMRKIAMQNIKVLPYEKGTSGAVFAVEDAQIDKQKAKVTVYQMARVGALAAWAGAFGYDLQEVLDFEFQKTAAGWKLSQVVPTPKATSKNNKNEDEDEDEDEEGGE